METGTHNISLKPVIGFCYRSNKEDFCWSPSRRNDHNISAQVDQYGRLDRLSLSDEIFGLQTNPFQVVLCFGTKTCWTLEKLPEVINYLAPLVTEELDGALPAWFRGRRWIKAEPEDKYILGISHNIAVQQRRKLLRAQECCR